MRRALSSSSASSSSSSSSPFQPAPPPAFLGQAVFPDISLLKNSTGTVASARQRNQDPDAVFVVTGSSRGIGLQFVKSLLERTQGKIVACCRSPNDASNALNQYLASSSNSSSFDKKRIQVLPVDVEQQETIDQLAATLRADYGRVDALFNVAGILGDGKMTPGPERSLSKMDRVWVEKTMAVNVIGPVMLAQALAPLMKQKQKANEESNKRSVIVNLSARVGSISDNQLGGWYSYRFSKAALNQATRTMAHELKRQGTLTVALHPGTTDTDLSKPFQANVKQGKLFPVDFTANQLLDIVDAMDDKHSGGFYDWSGKALSF